MLRIYTAYVPPLPISMTPASSGSFNNGVWTGKLTVDQAVTNVFLQADDGVQHLGRSNPFNVGQSQSEVRLTYARLSGSDVAIGFHGVTGTTYSLDRTDNLMSTNWVPIIEFRVGAVQDLDLIDSMSTNSPAQFYRIRVVPAP